MAPFAGRLADRVGERPLLVAGLAVHAIGYAWLALIAEPGVAYSTLVVPLVVTALGGSLALPPAASSVLRSVSHGAIGKAAGANGMVREFGGVFGIAISVAVFAAAGSYASAQAFSDGFAAALAVPVVLSLLGAVAAVAIPRREPTGAPSRRPPPARRGRGPRSRPSGTPPDSIHAVSPTSRPKERADEVSERGSTGRMAGRHRGAPRHGAGGRTGA